MDTRQKIIRFTYCFAKMPDKIQYFSKYNFEESFIWDISNMCNCIHTSTKLAIPDFYPQPVKTNGEHSVFNSLYPGSYSNIINFNCYNKECSNKDQMPDLDNLNIYTNDDFEKLNYCEDFCTKIESIEQQRQLSLDNFYYKTCNPYQNKILQIEVLICGIIITVLSCFTCYFWFNQNPNENIVTRNIVLFVCFFILLVATIFLSVDLIGKQQCKVYKKGSDSVCISKLSKTEIPQYFCDQHIKMCECTADTEDCKCISGTLFPNTTTTGQDDNKVIETSKKYVNWVLITFLVLLAILLPLLYVGIQRNYYIVSNNIVNISIIVLLALIPIICAIVFNTYKKKIYVNNNKCK